MRPQVYKALDVLICGFIWGHKPCTCLQEGLGGCPVPPRTVLPAVLGQQPRLGRRWSSSEPPKPATLRRSDLCMDPARHADFWDMEKVGFKGTVDRALASSVPMCLGIECPHVPGNPGPSECHRQKECVSGNGAEQVAIQMHRRQEARLFPVCAHRRNRPEGAADPDVKPQRGRPQSNVGENFCELGLGESSSIRP